jgi:hypothetical protein
MEVAEMEGRRVKRVRLVGGEKEQRQQSTVNSQR